MWSSRRARGGGGGGDPTIVRQYEDQMYMDLEPMRELVNTGDDGLTDAEAERRLRIFGKNELEEKVDHPLLKLAKGFTGPMPMMIWCARARRRRRARERGRRAVSEGPAPPPRVYMRARARARLSSRGAARTRGRDAARLSLLARARPGSPSSSRR